MKINFLKPIDTTDDFYGLSLIAENSKEKQFVKKMINANYAIKTMERQAASLIKKRVVISIEIENAL